MFQTEVFKMVAKAARIECPYCQAYTDKSFTNHRAGETIAVDSVSGNKVNLESVICTACGFVMFFSPKQEK
jgi:hypothetical protein